MTSAGATASKSSIRAIAAELETGPEPAIGPGRETRQGPAIAPTLSIALGAMPGIAQQGIVLLEGIVPLEEIAPLEEIVPLQSQPRARVVDGRRPDEEMHITGRPEVLLGRLVRVLRAVAVLAADGIWAAVVAADAWPMPAAACEAAADAAGAGPTWNSSTTSA